MKIRDLYRVVHGLSGKQKSNFSRFTNGKEKNLPIKLYERILKQDEFSSDSLKRIRDGIFEDSNKFRNNRNLLIDLIIKSIAHYEYQAVPVSSYVFSAIQIGVFDKAESIILDEMRRLQKLDSLSELVRFYDFIDELTIYYGFQIHLPTDILKYEVVIERQKHRRDLMAVIKELRKSIKLKNSERKIIARSFKDVVERHSDSKINQSLTLLAKVRIEYLQGEFLASINWGETLVEKLKAHPQLYPTKMIANEIEFVAALAILLEDRKLAIKYSLEMSTISSRSDDFTFEIKKRSIRLGATVAAGFSDKNLGLLCLKDLRGDLDMLDVKSQIVSYFNIGRCLFFNEDYKRVIECMGMVRNLFSNDLENLTWEPQAILAIAHHEIGEFDLADSFLRSANRYASATDKKFPIEAVGRIRRYISHGPNSNPPFNEMDLVAFREILTDPEEKKMSNNFPIQIWIEAHIRMVAPFELISGSVVKPVSQSDFRLIG